MTKLRHDRPALRYSDNVRRELQRLSLPGAAAPVEVTKTTPRRLLRPRDDKAYDKHLAAFNQLPEGARTTLDQLFSQAGQMMGSRLVYVESIGTRKRHAERSSAYEADKQALHAACRIYNAHCRDDVGFPETVGAPDKRRLRSVHTANSGHSPQKSGRSPGWISRDIVPCEART